ncbi:MAG: transcription-repair coupling factor, partial [Firmicutes bacterium]|nr:transcription-repair coupling factor [Bacillota bacterium]
KLADGRADIVCGTHRVLSADVRFKNLGLLILDEEQRFGVGDKEKIKLLKKDVNVLTLTATPIPRTLHMSLSGIRDISTLETPPADRLPVQTFVTEYSDGLVKDALNRELSRGGQAFVVCNDVARIDRYAAELSRLMPGARVSVGHGQMHGDRLEDVIRDFYEGNTDILVCSTIIENGIDLPRANTIIVTDSDRLGLSQLYQLRGRVGRSNRIAYAYFTYRAEKILTEDGYKRLRALMEFTELGSGFKLAMRDLEIRGAGTIMGAEQSGHIQRVGYELYCRMIAQAVKGGEPDAASRECRVDVEADAYIPESFIPDNDGRMRLYARIAAVESVAGCKKLMEEAAGIYGKLPPPVVNLINVGLIKGLGARAGALRVAVKGLRAEITFAKVTEKLMRVVETAGKCVLNMQKEPTITLSGTDTAGLLKFLISAGA